ncbi:MAG: hypothetical protein EXR07_12590 [Acetobacteraceae bacterium]|nr:hypothetical protein [Acetobacteraceae bacterium]
MVTSDVNALQRSDLNHFLFAEIGTEANGVALNVLSVFARLGSDPWTEAGRLASLPKADAADSLARMIAGMPKTLWTLPDASAIAVRLTGLLPARSGQGLGQGIGKGIDKAVRRWPNNQIALVAAAIALLVAVAVMLARH